MLESVSNTPDKSAGKEPHRAGVMPGSDRLDEFELMIDTLLLQPVRVLRAALPAMKKAGRGNIVMVTSGSGSPIRNPAMELPHGYLAGRGAAHTLVKSLAAELGSYQIQVNAVAPLLLYSETGFPSELGENDPVFAPFAWVGILAFYIPAAVILAWMLILSFCSIRSLKAELKIE